MVWERDGFPTLVRAHSPRKGVLRCAVLSRCLVIFISAFSNYMIADHNPTGVFIQPADDEDDNLNGFHFFDNLIKATLGGLVRWDAHHFLHIAKHGYVYENSLAFFPLFPLLTSWLSLILGFFFQSVLTESSILLLSATILNFAAFLKAADVFLSLSIFVLNSSNLAYTSAVLFCFNPASIFFSAPYTETLFCLLSFSGIYAIFKNNRDVLGCALLGLSAGTRSNGLLNLGFYLFKKARYFVTVLWPGTVRSKIASEPINCSKKIVKYFLSVLVCCTLVVTPFLSFEVYSYYRFCTPQDVNMTVSLIHYAIDNGLVLPSLGGALTRPKVHWCHSTVPLAYSYVQNQYWNVGFLKYFQLKQVPNFLLAFPIVCLILIHGIKFFQQHKNLCLMLGLTGKSVVKVDKTYRMSANMFVFMVHSVALTLFSFFCIHVQVTTRMIFSASPIPYWVGAYILQEGLRKTKIFPSWKYVNSQNDFSDYMAFLHSHLTKQGKALVLYFLFYFVMGTVLFSNFLPWT